MGQEILSFFVCLFVFHVLYYLSFLCIFNHKATLLTEKAMAPPSSTLAWKIPWAEESGRLQSMGSLSDGHD